jgi:hypothetical protein
MSFENIASDIIPFDADPPGTYVPVVTLTFDPPPGSIFMYVLKFDITENADIRFDGQGITPGNVVLTLTQNRNCIVINLLNNGWNSTGPFTDTVRFSFYSLGETTSGTDARQMAMPPERQLIITARNSGPSSLQIFATHPYVYYPQPN